MSISEDSKDIDLIQMSKDLDNLAAQADAFASSFCSYVSGVVDNVASYYYEYTRLLYILYHENTKPCLSLHSYDTEILRPYIINIL